jgi:hypothetical protein
MIVGKLYAIGAGALLSEAIIAGRYRVMEIDLNNSQDCSSKGSPLSISRSNVLSGYLHPTDYIAGQTANCCRGASRFPNLLGRTANHLVGRVK